MDDTQLSARQRQVLDAIRDLRSQNDMPPTLREIAEAVGLKSVASAKYQIDQLKNMGYLAQIDNVSRGISLADSGERQQAMQEAEANSNVVTGAFRRVPLVGQIAAGIPITAEQNVDEWLTLPESLIGKGDVFLLKVKGESMIDAAICDGDYVAIRQQQNADNGDIVAAELDGEATVKVFKQRDGHTWLLPQNSAFEPILGDHAKVMGKVTAVFRSL
ncbi:MAG: transcriptional repressor LexA [Actinomycetota bacterium]|jgi:repressor LexA